MVGLQPAQRLVEHLHRQIRAAAVGADLGHEEDLVAPALEATAEPVLGAAVPVLPAVVEKGDAGIDGLVDEPDRLLDRLEIAEVMAAEPQRRHLDAGAAERPLRDCARTMVLVRHQRLPLPVNDRARSRLHRGRSSAGRAWCMCPRPYFKCGIWRTIKVFLDIFRMTYWKIGGRSQRGSAGGGDGLSGQPSSDSRRGRSRVPSSGPGGPGDCFPWGSRRSVLALSRIRLLIS